MRVKIALALAVAVVAGMLAAQQSDVLIKITQGERVAIAVPDFRAAGGAQKFMDAFRSPRHPAGRRGETCSTARRSAPRSCAGR